MALGKHWPIPCSCQGAVGRWETETAHGQWLLTDPCLVEGRSVPWFWLLFLPVKNGWREGRKVKSFFLKPWSCLFCLFCLLKQKLGEKKKIFPLIKHRRATPNSSTFYLCSCPFFRGMQGQMEKTFPKCWRGSKHILPSFSKCSIYKLELSQNYEVSKQRS